MKTVLSFGALVFVTRPEAVEGCPAFYARRNWAWGKPGSWPRVEAAWLGSLLIAILDPIGPTH